MKTAIIALSAAALVSLAPAAPAKTLSSNAPAMRHHEAKKHHAGISAQARQRHTRAGARSRTGYPDAFGYATPGVSDQDFIRSRQFGGGGGSM
ncbi:hypothetical protein [Bradyrhizobium sp.]|uniref:hypothetical protein n=1 Tax=Bradyrhizobium sp. TaxID=376 RepID=UPI0025C3E187|nr:hypothetical protein [Bradyrhizobium sp.]MBV8920167.1 hypothetical protein [Bradyrhizobium sp.]